MLNDSRITESRTLLEDAQKVLNELGDELPRNSQIAAARFSLICALRHLKILEGSWMQCDRYMLTGGRCELEDGHEGQHRKSYSDHVYHWDDETTAREADRQGSRFD